MILGVDDTAVRFAGDRPGDAQYAAKQAAENRAEQGPGAVGSGDGLHLAASDVSGTVRVRAAASGLPVSVRVDPSLVVPGGEEALADRVLAVCRMASTAALARQRAQSAEAGVEDGVLDRLGLPGSDGAGAAIVHGGTLTPHGGTLSASGGAPSPSGDAAGEPDSWLMRA